MKPGIEPLPQYLYKYRDVSSRTLHILECNELYFADPITQFNDPFDCRILPYYEGPKKDILDHFRNKPDQLAMLRQSRRFQKYPDPLPKTNLDERLLVEVYRTVNGNPIGVLTLSEKGDDVVMFTHYSNDHMGICLKFDTLACPDFFSAAFRVEYNGIYPEINILKATDDEKLKCLYTKAPQWEYEHEWRIINHVDGQGLYGFPSKMLSAVIYGMRIDPQDKRLIQSLIAGRKIEQFQAHRKHGRFALELVREFP